MNNTVKLEILKIFHKNRSDFFLIVVLMLIAGFVQASSILGLMPIADFVVNRDFGNANRVTKFVVAMIADLNLPVNIMTLGCFYFFLIMTKNGVATIQRYATTKVQLKVMTQIIYQEYESFVNASWIFFGTKKYGTLANTVVRETEKLGSVFESLAAILVALITSLFYIALAAFISWKLLLIVLILTIFVVLPTYLLGKPIYRIKKIHTDAYNDFQALVYDTLNSLKLIVGFSKRKDTIQNIKSTIETIVKTSVQFAMIRLFSGLIGEPLGVLLTVVSVFYGLNSLNLDVAEMIAFLYAIKSMSGQVQLVINQRNNLKGSEPSLQQIYSLKNEADELKEPEGIEKIDTFNEITFSDVSFSYNGGKDVLKKINIIIAKGKMTAIVGPSGGGKSTMIDLIMGFYYPGSGSILVDFIPIQNINLHSWRNIVGYVTQQPFLFNASIRENLTWAKQDATEADIREACELANATEFIDTMDRNVDTVVGERGVRLSGGQSQRICLARALIKKPKVLILDEATSSLDSHSELMIQKSIEYLSGKTTIVSIAHRLSTIRNADYIYHIELGQIVEEGSFSELVKVENGKFLKAARLQGIAS
jgi:ABC-type multidrug transport system fused ATPase/permease subunit